MKNPLKFLMKVFSLKLFFILLAVLFALPAFAQKNKFKSDSIAVRDSIKEMMFQGALLSMDALQAKYESQKKDDAAQKRQKVSESDNLFFQSRACYRKAIAYDKNYFPAWSNMGTDYYLQDLPKAAIPCYKRALAINMNYTPAWFNLGKAYDMLGKKDSAVYSFKECVRSDSSYVQAYQELSRIVMANEKDSAAALNYLRLSTHYQKGSDVPWVSMSAIYFSYRDSVNGISCLETAASIYQGDIDRLQKLSDYFQKHNDPKKAAYYSNLYAAEKKKQEFTDPDSGE